MNPVDEIDELANQRSGLSDGEVLAELAALPPLPDEDDPAWDDLEFWQRIANPYLALERVAAKRRLRGAIRLLLDRACYGDPYEIMRGLGHSLEAIMKPDARGLGDLCMEAARGDRRGTVLWALDELGRLRDERARPLMLMLAHSPHARLRDEALVGLERLGDRDPS